MIENGEFPMPEGGLTVIPMIDARRMEVYAAPFSVSAAQVSAGKAKNLIVTPLAEVRPVVVGNGSFAEALTAGAVIFIGDGVDKCRGTIAAFAAEKGIAAPCFVQQCPEASSMLRPALDLFDRGAFEDVAYFEPFYLKEFVATVGKRLF